jgi:molecular chaperone GrpE
MIEPNSTETGNPGDPTASSAQSDPARDQKDLKISEMESQLKEKENKYLYLYADFENYKKRAIKERSDLLKFGWEPVASDLLLVVDNLERAIAHIPDEKNNPLLGGLQMVLTQFRSTLEKQGVVAVNVLKQPFDANFHEAGGQEPSSEPAGTIIKEQMRGYTIHGRLLRPARVILSSGNPT